MAHIIPAPAAVAKEVRGGHWPHSVITGDRNNNLWGDLT